jgi:hypothetical protein
MDASVWTEIEDLRKLTTGALRARYQELFGAESRSSNKQFLFRRIAWRLQARAEGDLNERVRRRAAEIADDADVRLRASKRFVTRLSPEDRPPDTRRRPPRDWRLPQPGATLTRQYHGQPIVVHVEQDGFEFEGRHYRSLSAIAREVTGTQWNGLAFFQLTERRRD